MNLARITAGVAAAALVLHARTAAALAARSEDTPLHLGGTTTTSSSGSSGGGSGGSVVRTLVGLAVVVLVIWGISWVLRQMKASRADRASGSGLSTIASLPLTGGGAVHVVRAGDEVLLLGVAEQQVTRLRTWTEEEADAAGLLVAEDDGSGGSRPVTPTPSRTSAAALVDTLRRRTVRR